MILYVTRKFSAAHLLPYYAGSCHELHGHTWKVEIWLKGDVNPDTGMVVDFKIIKNIIDQLDHTSLNSIMVNPTAENLVAWFINQFQSLSGITQVTVRLWESENSYAELSG